MKRYLLVGGIYGKTPTSSTENWIDFFPTLGKAMDRISFYKEGKTMINRTNSNPIWVDWYEIIDLEEWQKHKPTDMKACNEVMEQMDWSDQDATPEVENQPTHDTNLQNLLAENQQLNQTIKDIRAKLSVWLYDSGMPGVFIPSVLKLLGFPE